MSLLPLTVTRTSPFSHPILLHIQSHIHTYIYIIHKQRLANHLYKQPNIFWHCFGGRVSRKLDLLTLKHISFKRNRLGELKYHRMLSPSDLNLSIYILFKRNGLGRSRCYIVPSPTRILTQEAVSL